MTVEIGSNVKVQANDCIGVSLQANDYTDVSFSVSRCAVVSVPKEIRQEFYE